MALRQPCAYRADLWRRDAGGGSPLSPVSGADTERPAQAISCAVCTALSRLLNHVRCKETEPWSPTTVWLWLLTAILPHTLRGLLFLNDQNFVMTIGKRLLLDTRVVDVLRLFNLMLATLA